MLQIRTIEPRTLGLLKKLNQNPLLANNFWIGGTSLALQMGHRFSVDLDLFTHQPFNAEELLETLKEQFIVQPLTVTDTILFVLSME
jgi:Nucleotidyl transferase AbiEii toxin, Type IV TA system